MSWSGIRTVMVLELRQRVRATRWKVMLGIWALVLVLVCLGLTSLLNPGDGYDYASEALYNFILCFVLGIGLIVAPTLSAMSVNGDRADATLALLQATMLRSREIAVGKLLAAWVAAMAFLAVALPFLLVLTLAGGASWLAFLGHVLVLVITLGSVCGVGLGLSAMTARTSASAVLSYLVVVMLTIGTPLCALIASNSVTTTQTRVVYQIDYDKSDNNLRVCREKPDVDSREVVHGEWIWWMLAPNPYIILSDVSARAPLPKSEYRYGGKSFLEASGWAMDAMRTPEPREIVIRYCEESSKNKNESDRRSRDELQHLAFWPVSLLVLLGIGAGGVWTASRRLDVPVGQLPQGVRLA